MKQIVGANYSGTGPGVLYGQLSVGELALWGLLSLVAVAGLLYGILTVFGLA
jgi:hypothetical protein